MQINPILILPAITVIGSLFITYFCEYSVYNLLKIQDDPYTFIFTSFIVRSIVAYFITLTLFKKLVSNSADEHYRSTSLMYSQFLSKYGKMKLVYPIFCCNGVTMVSYSSRLLLIFLEHQIYVYMTSYHYLFSQ